MVFSSVIFIFYFLPAVLAAYYLLPMREATLLAFSAVFYIFGETVYVYVVVISIVLNYAFGRWIDVAHEPGRVWKLSLGVAVNLALLGYYKYAAFLFTTLAHLAPSLVSGPPPRVHLPLGISFFTFHAISYLVDVYRRQAPAERNFTTLAIYIGMFPQLIAGPIIRFHDIRGELHDRRVSVDILVQGVQFFILGLAQKVLIANTVAVPADAIFALPAKAIDASTAWLGVLLYAIQIYFDFGGYSLMAIGLGLMIGFHFPMNFNYPFISASITEFWRRWHITLSTWFRDYVYIPLGGNRHGPLATTRNLLTIFFLCGLWHGASWSYVVWGLFHGCFLLIERTRFGALLERAPRVLRHAYFLFVLAISWVLFRTDNLIEARDYLRVMFHVRAPEAFAAPPSEFLNPAVVLALVVGCIASTPLPKRVLAAMMRGGAGSGYSGPVGSAREWSYVAALFVLLFLSAASLAAGTYNPFIYYRF